MRPQIEPFFKSLKLNRHQNINIRFIHVGLNQCRASMYERSLRKDIFISKSRF